MNSLINYENKLYFATKQTHILSNKNTSKWLFKSSKNTFEISIPNDVMRNSNPSGQWLLCECDGMKIHAPVHYIKYFNELDIEETQQLIQFHAQQIQIEQQDTLCKIWSFYNQISNKELKHFFYQVLSNRMFISLFFSSRSDKQHSYIGGLLEHSMKIAENARNIAEQLNISSTIVDLSFIAGFLYNITKLKMKYFTPYTALSSINDDTVLSLVIREQLNELRNDNQKFYHILIRCLQIRHRISNTPYLIELIIHMALKLTK